MAESKTKNKNTLYRFVSLRSPELTKKENKENRFVFHPEDLNLNPDYKTGIYFPAIVSINSPQTKWEVLKALVPTSLFENEKVIEESVTFKDFNKAAEWLAQNKNKKTPEEIHINIINTVNLTRSDLITVWDNLFYQILNQKSFYVKESCMQMLVLHKIYSKL